MYLGHLDMVKMSLFDPYPSDGDNVLRSDESSSSTARCVRLVPQPPANVPLFVFTVYEFRCVRLSVCKDQCSQMYMWRSPG